MIVSNSDLVIITNDRDIYNFGRFDFVKKFKELKENNDDDITFNLNDFGEVVVTNLEEYSVIEQYGNMIFFKNNDKL